ncbi:MAG: LVIVD repeat-containing protein [Bacteroidia bacterium]
MKSTLPLLSICLAAVFLSLSGCVKDRCAQQVTYLSYEPVYLTFEELRAAGKTEVARELNRPGKFYYKDGYIFINEVGKGIHVVDNRDVNNPTNIGFINLPGSHDLAAKGNILYSDSYTDLVAIDITDPKQTSIVGREVNVFPYGMWHDGLYADMEYGVAIDWVEREVTEEVACEDISRGINNWLPRNGLVMEDAASLGPQFSSNSQFNTAPTSGGGGEVSTGVGGSMARFTILNDYLYTVTGQALKVFDISDLAAPAERRDVEIGWGIETIFPYDNHLLIGSQTGMFIFSTDNPESPKLEGEFGHVQSCDPVVAEGDIAYVTLRGGNSCGGFTNQLDVLDISNVRNPKLEYTYLMDGPYGLGIRNNTLFICDGESGLKVYDASDPATIDQNRLAHFPEINAYDVIPLNNVLLLIGKDGFYQYDFSDLSNIKLLSTIPVITL